MAPPLSRLVFWGLNLWILAYTLVLALALLLQFVEGEPPCPLCMLQRYGMILSTIGALWIVIDARRRTLTPQTYLQGLGLAALGAFVGAVFAARQVLLHILPGDAGYGDAVMGLHLYSWAFITFCVAIVFTCILAILAPSAMPIAPSSTSPAARSSSIIGLAFLAIIAVNAVMIIFLEGPAWVLPDNPTHYRLFGSVTGPSLETGTAGP